VRKQGPLCTWEHLLVHTHLLMCVCAYSGTQIGTQKQKHTLAPPPFSPPTTHTHTHTYIRIYTFTITHTRTCTQVDVQAGPISSSAIVGSPPATVAANSTPRSSGKVHDAAAAAAGPSAAAGQGLHQQRQQQPPSFNPHLDTSRTTLQQQPLNPRTTSTWVLQRRWIPTVLLTRCMTPPPPAARVQAMLVLCKGLPRLTLTWVGVALHSTCTACRTYHALLASPPK